MITRFRDWAKDRKLPDGWYRCPSNRHPRTWGDVGKTGFCECGGSNVLSLEEMREYYIRSVFPNVRDSHKRVMASYISSKLADQARSKLTAREYEALESEILASNKCSCYYDYLDY